MISIDSKDVLHLKDTLISQHGFNQYNQRQKSSTPNIKLKMLCINTVVVLHK